MPQFIQNIQIKNFKSAKNVRFEDCKRINLLIGKPNVGKSNLLEALSIFCLPFLKYLKKKDLQQFVRVENISELFCNGNVESDIQIQADGKQAVLRWVPQGGIEVSLQYAASARMQLLTLTNVQLEIVPLSLLVSDKQCPGPLIA